MSTDQQSEYVLGTDRDELERLRFQHQVWTEEALGLWERAGIRRGQVVIDLGCGPGFTSFELARVVGPDGTVIARDESPRFLQFVRAERERLALPWVEPSLGPVEELDLPAGSLDAAYARWLLCWVEDPGAVLDRVARCLKRGGVIALQDYLDWGAMRLLPDSEAFDRVVEACMRSWALGKGTIDIGERIPAAAAACGLEVEHLRPIARIGRVGSPEWRWLTEFFRSYLPKVVAQGLLDHAEHDAWLSEQDRREADGGSYCYTPTMLNAILRKP